MIMWKIDLEKVFDRLIGNFWKKSSKRLDFLRSGELSQWNVLKLNRSMKLVWNGEITEGFNPSKGIRQEDPLSSYLFVLCFEKLSHVILKHVVVGRWRTLTISRYGHGISRLMFVCYCLMRQILIKWRLF